MNQQPKLLITGASGYTGYHACEIFAKFGFDITAVVHKRPYINKGIKWEVCNLCNEEEIKNLITKVKPEYVLHLAGQNNVGDSWEKPIYSLEVNSMATAYLIEAIRQENPGCKILIVGSTLQFNSASSSSFNHPYGLSKTLQSLIAQFWATLYNMHIVIAKPSNLIGPGFTTGVCSNFAKKIVNMKRDGVKSVLEVSNLDYSFDFLDVRDAVRAYHVLLLKGESGEIYDVSSGKSKSLGEIINIFREITKVNFEVKSYQNSDKQKKVNISPLKLNKIGWQPTIPLKSSLKDTIDFYIIND
ncbi:NAD-dependent epimerase/dehydratase family protein [Priestia megaterium]